MAFDRHLLLQMLQVALDGLDLFLLDLTVSESVQPKITVVLDGPEGLGINEIVKVTRRLNRAIEEQYGEEAQYSLEVTSPGADQPLADPRQYLRHVGRTLALTFTDGTTKEGTLLSATPEGIEIEEVIKVKTKKTTLPPTHHAFADIAEAKVVISFK